MHFLIFGLLLYFYIIPNHIELAGFGWVYPSTIPNAVAIILILSGAAVFFKPTRHCARPAGEMARAGLFWRCCALGFGSSHRWGLSGPDLLLRLHLWC